MIPFLDMKSVYTELKPELDAAYARVMESGWFVLGKEVEAFEQEYAAFCGTRHCVGLGNGLEALELCLRAWDLGAGDEVIVPSNTYIATWLAVIGGRRDGGAGRADTRAARTSIPIGSRPRSRRARAPSCRSISTASRPTWTPSWRGGQARPEGGRGCRPGAGREGAGPAHRRAGRCRRAQLLPDQEYRRVRRRRRR